MKITFILLISIILQTNINGVKGQSNTKTNNFPPKQSDEKIEFSTVDISATTGCNWTLGGLPLDSSSLTNLALLRAGVQPGSQALNILSKPKPFRLTPNKKRRSLNHKHQK
jgi:hypothetical protein